MMLLAFVSGTWAQDEHLKVHFDFSQVDGTTVTDVASGISARLTGEAKVEQIGKYGILNLGNASGYLDMTSATGNVIKSLGDFTISVCYCVDDAASLSGNGFFLWTFSTSAACTQTEGKYMAYRLNAQRMATSTGGYGSESAVAVGTASAKGRWIHVLYRQTGQQGELFVDGKRVGQNIGMPILSETFTVSPAYCWIGRAPFSGDNYLKQTEVADLRIYDMAVSDELLEELAAVASDIEQEMKYGEPGDFTELQAKVEECKTFVNGDVSSYAPNAVAELKDVITVAELEINNARASQHLIDQYKTTLSQLLSKAKATNGYQPKLMFSETSDHGFVHPGGIVSQQDIDRAKQLLAAGDERITKAWNMLCSNEYAQAGVTTYPVETIIRGGGSGENYINVARGAAMAYQNALRWKIGGTRANADAAVRILMAWARGNRWVSGDTNLSLAAGIYGHELANAAELMRDYDGWSREDFDEFRQYMIRTWYNPAIDFLRRRHDTWLNASNSGKGQRPGHYWSNWGLCNALCVMSIGILCDDVHMYNQGVSFYKYDHVGTFKDRSTQTTILNDGLNEFIGNLVPVVLPDERGPLGYLGQMQESGRDQGHALMALGLALDICQVGLTQGDDLYAYMDDRIAAGLEHVAAYNFDGVTSLPWINYNYADCRTTMGAGWGQSAPNEGGKGGYRPYWDRAIGYYEGLRGVKLQYAEKASAAVCPDGGGGNYGQNSGGYDHVGFSTLTSWRPTVSAEQAITPLHGDIVYKGVTYENQTNLGGLKYNYNACVSKAILADGANITLIPQLPEGVEDTGNWSWNTGETTRQITAQADRSYIYRVTYTAQNGTKSQQAFAIAVRGDAQPDAMTNEMTIDGTTHQDTVQTVLAGSDVILHAGATTGWTNDYLWDNGQKTSTVTVHYVTTSRTYTCQYANQSGAVSESRFHLNVVDALQHIIVGGAESETNETQVLAGTGVTLKLIIPATSSADDVVWSDGSKGTTYVIDRVERNMEISATYHGVEYTYNIYVKAAEYGYYDMLTSERGYKLVTSADEIASLAADSYFVLASDQANLLIGLKDAPLNGNKALFFQTPADPVSDLSKVFTIEPYGDAFCLRNIDYDGLLLQTEWDRPDQLRTHDQPLACEWTRLLFAYADGAWTVENGKYPGNWLGLWT
ncbi:MAG: alginate lyase family protein, partial [Prevotella sp.]|nr:alginate lyase family protein [Prevotella sp.]